MLDSLPYDILELVVFRLCLLTAADIGALKRTCKGMNSLLSAKYDVVRHHAVGGLRHCLDSLNPAAVLYLLKNSSADPAADEGRPLRVAIRASHAPLFNWLVNDDRARAGSVKSLKFALTVGAEWAVSPLLTLAKKVKPWERLIKETMGHGGLYSPTALKDIIDFIEWGCRVGGAAVEPSSIYFIATMLVPHGLLAYEELSRRLADSLVHFMKTPGGFDLDTVYYLSTYVVEWAGTFRESPERIPGYPHLFRLVVDSLPAGSRADLGYALMGVGSPDLAEAAVGPVAFAFVVGPSTFEEALANCGGFPPAVANCVRNFAPTELLVRLASEASPSDFNEDLSWVLYQAVKRPDPEAREILLAACPPEARDSRRESIDRILELKEGAKTTGFYLREGYVCGPPGRAMSKRKELLRAYIHHYRSAFVTKCSVSAFLDFGLGLFGGRREHAEVYSAIGGKDFSWGAFHRGEEAWKKTEAPNDAGQFAVFSQQGVFYHRAGDLGSVDELLRKAGTWADEIERVWARRGTKGLSKPRCVFLAAVEWAHGRHDTVGLSVQDIVELDLFFEGVKNTVRTGDLIQQNERVPVAFARVAELAAAGVDVLDSCFLKLATVSSAKDLLPDHLEYLYSGVWPGVSTR
jgi:hypothetical protein